MNNADELYNFKESIFKNYAKFLFEIKISKYEVSYNLARVVLENSFKYIALDVNNSENLNQLFLHLIKEEVLLEKISGIDKLSTWKYYLFSSHFRSLNSKYQFFKKYAPYSFDDALSVANASSHQGVSKNTLKVNDFIKNFVEEYFNVVDASGEWKTRVTKEIDSLKYNANNSINSPSKNEKGETKNAQPNKVTQPKGKAMSAIMRKVYHLLIGLIIVSVFFGAYLLLKSNNKSQSREPEVTQNPTDTVPPIRDVIPETSKGGQKPENVGKPTNETGTNEPAIENQTEPVKGKEQIAEPVINTVAKYISDDDFKNREGSSEMAVLIVNSDNNTTAAISSKVSSVFLRNLGYNNTASLLSRQFVTDGLFEKVFSGGGINSSKQKFSDFADFFCLGKLNIETSQSDVRSDMIKATINLEIKVVKTTNGAEIINFFIPSPHNIGAGFSKQQAVEVATENIINYLKKYKYEN